MDRFTIPDEPIEGGIKRTVIDARLVRQEAMTIYWLLKEYEDVGLEPDEIRKLAEYRRLEDQKQLVKLPCKVGDIGYGTFAGRVSECFCIGWKYTGGGLYMICMDRENHQNYSFFDFLFGEKWFLNREEAERALSKK